MAVRHPDARLGHVEQDVDGLAGPDEDGVLPDEVLLGSPVAREHDEPARAVDVERVVHRRSESISFTSRSLTPSPTRNFQSIAWFTAPVSRSTRFQRMFAGVVIRLTSTMSSSHSIPPASACCPWPWWVLVPVLAAGGMLAVARGLRDEPRGEELHAALRAVVGLSRTTSGCMGQT